MPGGDSRSLPFREHLSGTREWQAAFEPAPFETVLSKVKVTMPGGQHYESTGVLRWDPFQGATLDVLENSSLQQPSRTKNPGAPLQASDLYSIEGYLPNDVRVNSDSLLPKPINAAEFIRHGRSAGGRVISFIPPYVFFKEAIEASTFPHSIRRGILQCAADLPWGEPENRQYENALGGGSGGDLNGAKGELAGGYFFSLLRLSANRVRCQISGPDDGRIEAAARQLEVAIGVASGSHCRWLSWNEESQGQARIFLTNPTYAPGFRLPPIDREVPYQDLLDLIQQFAKAFGAKPELVEKIATISLCWNPEGTFLEVLGLIACCVLESMVTMFRKDLPGTDELPDLPSAEIDAVRKQLEDTPISSMSIQPRLMGLLNMLNQHRAIDVLYAVQRVAPHIVSEAEIQAWKRLRNPSAHGTFSQDPDLLRKVGHVYNLISKIAFGVVKYGGVFRDYSQEGWPVTRFFPERKAIPPSPSSPTSPAPQP